MKTSNYNRFSDSDPGAISISLYPPRGKNYKHYPDLAPGKLWWRSSPDIYIPLYDAALVPLDPQQVWDELHKLAGGAEPIILCYESIPEKYLHLPADEIPSPNFCHRRKVAEWFELHLGVQVPEFVPAKRGKIPAPAEGQTSFFL